MSTSTKASQGAGNPAPAAKSLPAWQSWGPAGEYLADTFQRHVLFVDLLRRRQIQDQKQRAKAVPHVLSFEAEPVMDARRFKRPANYLLVRIKPPAKVKIDQTKRPFVVVDPRAGHGPGIGGFKADSELGVAMRAGHPAYFVGFTPEPVEGQTIEDIMHAEATFLEKVIELHPHADGKPCVIGNCQAGWAVMMAAAMRPELFGPIIIAGSPLSYWAGVEGANPMRYTGGLTGGSWVTALASDLGAGKFDGGHLVQNFENLNPANTLWSKPYDVWADIDKGAERFLAFEKWWGAHVDLNAEEIQWIVDELFIGNKLATGNIVTSDGARIDLRHIRSPIICFCSKGDNITPPQQALGWITDLYDTDEDIRAHGQTIVYAVHEHVGHLGIFVSGGVAKKEHQEFASNIDLIDVLPPGLYEAVLTPKTEDTANEYLVSGEWVARFEPRSIRDVRDIVQPNEENERRFAAAKRLSDINLALYRSFVQPMVQAAVTPSVAAGLKQWQALASPDYWVSAANPLMANVENMAEQARQHRVVSAQDNPFLPWQQAVSEAMVNSLDAYRQARDNTYEQLFLATYGSPLVQALLGVDPVRPARRRAGMDPHDMAAVKRHHAAIARHIKVGGLREATIRALIDLGMSGDGVDERAFNELRLISEAQEGEGHPAPGENTLAAFKRDLRTQHEVLLFDREAAIAAMSDMMPSNMAARRRAYHLIRQVALAAGKLSPERAARLKHIGAIFTHTAGEASSAEGESKPAVNAAASKPAKTRARRPAAGKSTAPTQADAPASTRKAATKPKP